MKVSILSVTDYFDGRPSTSEIIGTQEVDEAELLRPLAKLIKHNREREEREMKEREEALKNNEISKGE